MTLRWTDADGDHASDILPPGSGLVVCSERSDPSLDWVCGRVEGHKGSLVPTDHYRQMGAVAL